MSSGEGRGSLSLNGNKGPSLRQRPCSPEMKGWLLVIRRHAQPSVKVHKVDRRLTHLTYVWSAVQVEIRGPLIVDHLIDRCNLAFRYKVLPLLQSHLHVTDSLKFSNQLLAF